MACLETRLVGVKKVVLVEICRELMKNTCSNCVREATGKTVALLTARTKSEEENLTVTVMW